MVPAPVAADVVRQAVARGIPRVRLHRGIGRGSLSAEAVAVRHDAGNAVVDGACPFMFEPPARGVHRLHRAVAGRRIAA